jgi:predicted phosphodiesterase
VSGFEPFRFVFMADCQLGAYASFSGATEADVAVYAESGMTIRVAPPVEGIAWDVRQYERAIGAANRLQPAFVVMGGDMVNDPHSDAEYSALREVTNDLAPGIPMHWVAGNHDVAFDTVVPTGASVAAYRRRFGEDSYVFEHNRVTFIVVNTVIWDHPEDLDGAWDVEVVRMERGLAAARDRGSVHTIVLGHHPLFTDTADEEDSYWNIPSVRREPLLELFAGYDVRAMFCGHWHRNGGGTAGDLDMVVSGPVGYPLGRDPSGFRIVDVGSAAVEHHYVSLSEFDGEEY